MFYVLDHALEKYKKEAKSGKSFGVLHNPSPIFSENDSGGPSNFS